MLRNSLSQFKGQIRFNSTVASPIQVKNTIPSPVVIFPELSKVSAKDLYGSKAFGGTNNTYFIKRSKFGHLPVYTTIKSKARYTEIRKISGNVIQLRNELLELLPELPAKEVKIIQQSNKIVMKGDYTELIKKLFESKF